MYRHILIPTDGSKLAEHGVAHGLALANSVGAKVSVIFVVEPFSEMTGRFLEAVAKYADAQGTGRCHVGSRGKCGQGSRCFLRDDSGGERATPSSHHRSGRGKRLRSHCYVIARSQRTFHASHRQCDKQGADASENSRTGLSVSVQTTRWVNRLPHSNDGTVAEQNDLRRDRGTRCDHTLSRRHLRIRDGVQQHLVSHAWPRRWRKPSSFSDPELAFYRAVPTHRRAS